jgi:mRNA interferase MazF
MDPKPAAKEAEHLLKEISKQPLQIVQQDPDIEKIKLETERDLYRNLYNELLSKTMKGASA